MNLPKHIAIIMDGNRRWAKINHLPQLEGHRRGEEIIEPIIDRCVKLNIPNLTFWAFSTQNWNRDKREVNFLMNLYRSNLDRHIDNFHRKNVKLNIIGNLEKFPSDLVKKTQSWIDKTKNNKIITVNIALGYGGRDEIIRAVNKWHNNLKLNPDLIGTKLTLEEFPKYLDTAGQPDPDLLIRTGGEIRLSGFLLWQLEYAELYFTKVLWPNFTVSEFNKAIVFYQNRQRRFGR